MVCARWLRRDYLRRVGRQPDEPPCKHEHCPPTDAEVVEAEARRLGEPIEAESPPV
jgi:hypothetical protein